MRSEPRADRRRDGVERAATTVPRESGLDRQRSIEMGFVAFPDRYVGNRAAGATLVVRSNRVGEA